MGERLTTLFNGCGASVHRAPQATLIALGSRCANSKTKMATSLSSVVGLRPKARAPAAGRPTRLAVQANVRLAHVKQNTQQKIASMQVGQVGGACGRIAVAFSSPASNRCARNCVR